LVAANVISINSFRHDCGNMHRYYSGWPGRPNDWSHLLRGMNRMKLWVRVC